MEPARHWSSVQGETQGSNLVTLQPTTTRHHNELLPFHPKPTGQGQGLTLRACPAAASRALPSVLMSEHFCPDPMMVYKKMEQVGAGRAELCQEGCLSTPPAFQGSAAALLGNVTHHLWESAAAPAPMSCWPYPCWE